MAIKVLDINQKGKNRPRVGSIMAEVQVLKKLKHPNIVQYQGFVRTPGKMSIILEYCPKGSLATLCKHQGRLPEIETACYTEDILKGLQYLHANNIIHRDIKGANLLISADGRIKLADFGVATFLKEEGNFTCTGSPHWMAPEVIEAKGTSSAADIWSLGSTVVEMLTGHPPHYKKPLTAIAYTIITAEEPPIPERVSSHVKNFLQQCFAKIPAQRATATQLLKHMWIMLHREARHKKKELVSGEALGQAQRVGQDVVKYLKPDCGGGNHSPNNRIKAGLEEIYCNDAVDNVCTRALPIQHIFERSGNLEKRDLAVRNKENKLDAEDLETDEFVLKTRDLERFKALVGCLVKPGVKNNIYSQSQSVLRLISEFIDSPAYDNVKKGIESATLSLIIMISRHSIFPGVRHEIVTLMHKLVQKRNKAVLELNADDGVYIFLEMMRNETANNWCEVARTGLKQIERIIVTSTKTRTRLSKPLAIGIIETSVTLLKRLLHYQADCQKPMESTQGLIVKLSLVLNSLFTGLGKIGDINGLSFGCCKDLIWVFSKVENDVQSRIANIVKMSVWCIVEQHGDLVKSMIETLIEIVDEVGHNTDSNVMVTIRNKCLKILTIIYNHLQHKNEEYLDGFHIEYDDSFNGTIVKQLELYFESRRLKS